MTRTGAAGPLELFSLIIVDDEESVRVGLADLVDWAGLGFRLLRTFDDGDRAIEYLATHRVDIVLTDIVMARKSGLDVAAFVQDQCPATDVVILTGHDDFALAKRAIETRVRHYILKPTDLDELRQVFRGVRDDLVRRREEDLRSGTDEELVKEMTVAARQRVLLELSQAPEEHGGEWLRTQLSRAQLPDSVAESPVASASIAMGSEERSISAGATDRVMFYLGESTDALYPVPLVRRGSIELIALTAVVEDSAELGRLLDRLVQERAETLRTLLGHDVSVVAAEAYKSVFDWARSARRRGSRPASAVHAAVGRSLEVIETLLESAPTIERVADEVSLSVSYFSHLFHADMGTTFARYLRDRRVVRAKKYLRETDHTVQEISERVGYASAKHFYRVFHEVAGTTPAAYRSAERGDLS